MELKRIDTALRSIQESLEEGTVFEVPPSPDLIRRFRLSDHVAVQALIDRFRALPRGGRIGFGPPEEIAFLGYEEMLKRFGRPDEIDGEGYWNWSGLPGDPKSRIHVGFRGGMATSFRIYPEVGR